MSQERIRGTTQIMDFTIPREKLVTNLRLPTAQLEEGDILFKRNGEVPATGDFNLDNHIIGRVKDPVNPQDVVNLRTLDSRLAGFTPNTQQSPTVTHVTQLAHGFTVGTPIRAIGTNTYARGNNTTAANAEVVGMVSAVTNANEFDFISEGRITGLSGLTAGEVYFIGPTDGSVTTVTPVSPAWHRPILIADSASTGFVLQRNVLGLSGTTSGGSSSLPAPVTITAPSATGTTVEAVITFAYGDASPRVLATPQSSARVNNIRLVVDTPFNGSGGAISVGTATDHNAFMDTTSNDPYSKAEYQTTPGANIAAGTDILLFIAPGTASQGNGVIYIGFN